MQELLGTMRRAITDYNMISPGDNIAIGVSGGKDSMVLLEGMSRLRQFLGIPFDIVAITIDPGFNNQPGDFSTVEAYCAEKAIPYVVHRSQLAKVIFEIRKEKNPCSLCSRMRRGMLHDLTKEHGCNKIALGHHKDDAVETFIMNLFQEGRIGCFQPVTYLSRKDITMIRPMIYLDERRVVNAAKRSGLPVIKSSCPADETTLRQWTKQWLTDMEKSSTPDLREKIFGALSRSQLKGWEREE